jgi:PhzF family phenazine biosynthesis protein
MNRQFRILNVFTVDGARLTGNPLCVFENGDGLDGETMQALALQFNLSETTFLLPSSTATARVRIFSPAFEMPFAGHPTLGTAHVARSLHGCGDSLTLEMTAGIIPVTAVGDRWTLGARAPSYRAVAATDAELAAMLGLDAAEVVPGASWVDTGSDQLVIPLRSVDAVRRCAPIGELLRKHGSVNAARYLAYVFADNGERVTARFFFPKGPAVVEDPATGSACANLGGWFLAQKPSLPLSRTVEQGAQTGRPSRLGLSVDTERRIFVSGEVIELARGSLDI